MAVKLWIICYDIKNGRRLRKIAKIMENYGQRVQRSVFECWLREDSFKKLAEEIASIIKKPDDSIRFYTMCADCRLLSEIEGKTKIELIKEFYIV